MLSTTDQERMTSRHKERQLERQTMKRLFLVVFPLCFVAVALTRLITVFGPRDAVAEGSVFAEAKASAYAALGYAFNA
ncbi:hypothetical protein GWI72_00245 [Microvirga tunisiensis]|uniref:Uncharacterized protein n=2 Tax=Pannonibacter tanglangensis TaxID=2750084 RepID=A0A7X5F0T5_9HYPH|nr:MULTISPECIES: hypothetical protein [unclassified Pannonibacter]NBN63126.1 hypothetical protein [Pannonibacter sp. XCT-34]NBN76690.1 hypothetical protein [Pannonibacter sp. XCT-53]